MAGKLRELLGKFARTRAAASSTDRLTQAQKLDRAGHAQDAEPQHRELIEQDPHSRVADESAAALAAGRSDFAEALRLYDRLILTGVRDAILHYQRGNARNALGLSAEAVADYDLAIELRPAHTGTWCNRGVALGRMGRWEDSLDSYQHALQVDPRDSLTLYNRAAALKALQRRDEALHSYDEAIRSDPRYVDAYVNRGHLLQELRRYAEAAVSYEQAIALNTDCAEAYQGRGVVLEEMRDFAAAAEAYDRALGLAPQLAYIRGQRRHARMQICDWRGLADDQAGLSERLQRGEAAVTPFTMLALVDAPHTHRLAAQLWATRTPSGPTAPMPGRRERSRKLRVGYFSPDFREHAVGQLAVGAFEAHDRSRFETVAFAFGPCGEDPMRTRLRTAFDRFVDVDARTDAEIASLARECGLDIAVDLAGHTAHSRPGIFAARAAPIQVSFLGYPGTLGATWVDYVVGDRTVLTPEFAMDYHEKFIILPYSYLPYDSAPVADNPKLTRDAHGLPEHAFVFCCINNAYKITPTVFDCWMRILLEVPDSVLWLSWTNGAAIGNLRREASRRGINADRLMFAPRLPRRADHLDRLSLADLFLDTWPYNAHATAMDALYAGVPLLTKLGAAFAGRVAAGILRALDLQELVVATEQEFETTAVALARHPDRLRQLRRRLDDLRTTSPVFSAVRYVRNLEQAYQEIYARDCDGHPPGNVHVTDNG